MYYVVLLCVCVFYAETATEQVHINATYQQIQFHTSGIQTECKYKSIILYIYLQVNLIRFNSASFILLRFIFYLFIH